MKKSTKRNTINPVVYIGPTVHHIGLTENATFTNGIPEHAKKAIEECSYIKDLFVPITSFSKANKNKRINGKGEYFAYRKVLIYRDKGAVK